MSKGWKKIQYTLVHWGEYRQKSFTLEHIFISLNPLEFKNLLYRKNQTAQDHLSITPVYIVASPPLASLVPAFSLPLTRG